MNLIERTPLLSIVVPVYHAEAYLRDCLESIVRQTYRNLEIILVEDGVSADGSHGICCEYAATDERVKVLSLPHGGPASARKAGIFNARGEYVACVDNDDWLELDTYESLLRAAGEQSPDVIMFDFRREFPDKTVVCHHGLVLGYHDEAGVKSEIHPHFLETRIPYQLELLPGYWDTEAPETRIRRGPNRKKREMKIYAGIVLKLVKRELLQRVQHMVPDNLFHGEDMVCTVGTLLEARSVLVTNLAPYHYRIRPNSLARTENTAGFEQYQLLFNALYSVLSCQPLADVYLPRLSRMLADKAFVNRYERFLTGRFSDVLFGSLEGLRVALYGAGRFGKEIHWKTTELFHDRITLWVERDYKLRQREGLPVKAVETLLEGGWDVVLLAVIDEGTCTEIMRDLTNMGISQEKIRRITVSPEILKAVEAVYLEDCEHSGSI